MNTRRSLRLSLLTLLALALLFSSLPVRAFASAFSLEQILSSPFPSDLIVSKKGDKVAWVFDAQGRRNIWVAEAPLFRGRQLTRYAEDDGQEITEPVFSPDGSMIAFVHGGAKNTAGEIPNPTSNPSGAKQEVFVADVRTGAVTKLGEGETPVFTPQGDAVLYSREDHLWTSPVRGVNAKEKKLFEIRGRVGDASWSPDGTQLLFVSSRTDHSFITIYDPRRSQLKFLQTSVDRDTAPRWSPDGKRITFIRLYNIMDAPPAPDRERIAPWSIFVVDAQTGQGKEIWKSGRTELDSISNRFDENVLQWAGNDRLIFGSEKDGWAHLYSLNVDGGEAKLLTPGNYEVENIAWSTDHSFLVLATNEGDIDHRHLWRLDLNKDRPTPITRGDSIEMYPVILGGGKIAFLHSTARDPFQPYIANADGSNMKQLAPQALPADFPSAALIIPEQVIFKSGDGLEIHGQLFKPKNASGKMPAVVFMHGGPMRQMLLGWHYMYYYHNSYAFNQYLASRGYMVLSVNYRAGIGYGRAFREAKNRGARGASEYQDIVAAGKYLRSRSDVDDKRIGLWGGSYGGFLTAMGLARNSDIFAAGVDLHGVHDWSLRIGAAPQATGEMAKLGRESSPISSVDKWKSPVLLIHGDDDRNVAFSQTVELVRRLRAQNVEFEQLIFPDEVHDFLRHEHWLQAYHAASDFFDKHLKGASGEATTMVPR